MSRHQLEPTQLLEQQTTTGYFLAESDWEPKTHHHPPSGVDF
jgi:hypothetical protein